jgi:phage gp45-like
LGIYSNSGDGIDVSAPGTISDISSRDLRVYSNGGNGVNIEFGVTTAFSTIQSTFSGNSNAGLFLAGGTGHSVYSSFFSGSVYGINVSSLGATNSQTLSVSNSSFSSNSTNDLFVGTAVPYVLWYPQISQTATVSDTGGKVHRFTVTP